MINIKSDLKGIIVPLVTPLTDEEELDVVGLEKQINRMIDSNVHGIFVGGSMGEYPNLTEKVKIDLIDKACDLASNKLLILANISENSEKKVWKNIAKIKKLPVDCYVVTAPFYFFHSQNDLRSFFSHVADFSDKPLLIYNIPIYVGQSLSPELIFYLMNHPNIIGLKDSSGDFSQFSQILLERNTNFATFQGAIELTYVSFLLKCDGAIPGLGNLIPKEFVTLFALSQEGKFADAEKVQVEINAINKVFNQVGGIVAIKYALSLLNICSHRATKPFPELNEPQKQLISETLCQYQILT